jgi:hypothetical protein
MTGIVTVDQKTFAEVSNRIKIIIDWTSDTSGNVESDPINAIGFVTEIERIPGALGDRATNRPTDLYNTYIKDPYGCSLIEKAGDGSRTIAQRTIQSTPLWVDDYMIVSLTETGSERQGRLIIWLQRDVPNG